MNLDDLLKSIGEEDDDSKGGKDLDDLLESIRSEEKPSTINPAKFFDNDEYDDYYKELVDEGSIDDQNLSEEERQRGIAAFRSNKLDFKKFVFDILSLKPEVEQLNQEPLTIREQFFTAPKIEPDKLIPAESVKVEPDKLIPKDESVKVEPDKLIPQDESATVIKVESDKLIPQDESENEEIIEKLNELIAVIKSDNDLEKAQQDYDKKIEAEEKRKEREKRIEVGKIFGINRTVDKIIKKSQDIFDSIIKFLAFTVLGQIVKFVTDFLRNPKNKEFIDNTINFIKSIPDRLRQAREKIQPVIDFFVGMIPKVQKFAEDFRKLITKFPFLGQFAATEKEKEEGLPSAPGVTIFPGGIPLPNMGPTGFPGFYPLLGSALIGGGVAFGDAMLGTQPAAAGTLPKNELLPGSRSSGFYISPEERKMLDAISGAEGTKGYGTVYGGRNIPELARGEMTINQVLNMQETGMYKGQSVYKEDEYNSTATGRYQFMPVVLREEAERAGLDLNTTKFTPELQDELILRRIRRMRGVTPELLRSEGMSDVVIDKLAPEFASFPNLFGPDAKGRYGTNTSYYGQGGKSADFIRDLYNKSSGMDRVSPTPPPVMPPPGLPPVETKDEGKREIEKLGEFIFESLRKLLPVGTPNSPTSSKIIVLPPIKQQAKQPTTTQTSNEIPNFKVSSGVQMRGLVGKALGIEDLVSWLNSLSSQR